MSGGKVGQYSIFVGDACVFNRRATLTTVQAGAALYAAATGPKVQVFRVVGNGTLGRLIFELNTRGRR